MAKVTQIYTLVNDAAKEALGSQAITVKDTGSLVSLGDVVLSSTENTDAFYKTLVDRIGRTVIAGRVWNITDRSVKRDDMEWGCVFQKISIKKHQAVENPSWDETAQANPYDIEMQSELVQKLFSKVSTWSYEDSIPSYQLYTAFTSESAMDAVISLIYVNMENEMRLAEADLANLAVDTNMAGIIKKGKESQKRHLLTEYNAKFSKKLTADGSLTDADFLKFASREINLVVKNMKMPSVIYTAEDIPRFTPEDKMVVEILGQFASATASYLESDTYHKELVALPRYEEVAFWQAPGTSFAFADVSKIHIQNAEIDAEAAVEQSGIVAFIHDYDSCASIITRRRDYSKFNERSERMNVMMKADKGYAVDLSENGVVFILD